LPSAPAHANLRAEEEPTTSEVHAMTTTKLPKGRLTHPWVREDGVLRPATWEEALDRAAAGLAPARDLDTSKSFGMFSCSKASNEMNYLAGKFTRQVMGSNNVDSCNRT
jgi:formate dehydrogenase major subunit